MASRTLLVEIPDNTPLNKIVEIAENTNPINDDLDWEHEPDCDTIWRPALPEETNRAHVTFDEKPYIEA